MRTFMLVPAVVATATLTLAQPGTLDPTFGTSGIKILEPGTLHDVGHEVIALPDTTLLVCGVAYQGGEPVAFIGRLLQDGSVDAGFGTSSGYTFFDSGEETYAYDMALASDGSIYMCGTAYPTYPQQKIALFHLLADGTPDAAFGTAGMLIIAYGSADAEAQGIAVQPDDHVVIAGRSGFGSTSNSLFMRFTPTVAYDNTFSGDGIFELPTYASEDMLYDVGLLADGSIVATGYANIIGDEKTILVKLDANGAPVTSFGGDGVVVPGLNATADKGWGLATSGQQFFVTGTHMDVMSDYDTYIAKFEDNGGYASGFGTAGYRIVNTNVNETGFDVELQADGKPVVCGTTGQFGFGANRDFLMIRFNTNGTTDASFGANGVVITPIQSDFDDANGCAVQVDGKILSAGFTSGFSIGGNNDLTIVRYLGDGTVQVPGIDPTGPLALYPIPANEVLNLTEAPGLGTTIEIHDATGREAMRTVINGTAVDISALPAGIHHLQLIRAGGVIARARFVKE